MNVKNFISDGYYEKSAEEFSSLTKQFVFEIRSRCGLLDQASKRSQLKSRFNSMGTILTTPSKPNKGDAALKETNNNLQSNLHSSKLNLNFTKFNFVHDCLPTLGSKENKFFPEKVSSNWLKGKGDSKKKAKAKNAPESYKKLDSTTKLQIQVKPSLTKDVLTEKTQRPNTDAQRLRAHSASQPELHTNCGNFSLSETLKYIGCYVYLRCRHIDGLKPSVFVSWVKGVDRGLIYTGWQEHGFLSHANMIVLYMLLREMIRSELKTLSQLKGVVMSCLYMCYAYNGHEISYPLKPFLTDGDRSGFWDRCMVIVNNHSGKMLRINKQPSYYNEMQLELRNFGHSIERRER